MCSESRAKVLIIYVRSLSFFFIIRSSIFLHTNYHMKLTSNIDLVVEDLNNGGGGFTAQPGIM